MIIFNSKKYSKIVLLALVILGLFTFWYFHTKASSLNQALLSKSFIDRGDNSKEEIKNETVVDTSKYAHVMPVEPGTKWIYEGKRIWYDSKLDPGLVGTAQETTGQKIVEIKSIKKEGDNLRVFISVSYKNNPDDFDKFKESFVLSESGYAFDGTNLSYFPLVKGQRLSPSDSDFERTDNYYVSYVYSVSVKNVLGKQARCYDIVYDTLPDESLDTFCEGIGYIRNSYKHHGTPDEWDYNLILIEHPVLKD